MVGGRAPSPKKEKDLIAVLRSKAPKVKKADACKDLSVYGSPAAVPDLAPLLADEQLASWARIALEAIPGQAADEALRNSLGSLKDNLLVGAINSIGVRRDSQAVQPLMARLQDKNTAVASAAAVALGHIAGETAVNALKQSLATAAPKLRAAVAQGLVLAADRNLASGRLAQAADIYDAIRKADVPNQRILEATRGVILARRDEGIPLLIEQLHSPDKRMFRMALITAREVAGSKLNLALAAELDRLVPERAALLIEAMADRKDSVVLAALLKAAAHGPQPVRVAAVTALGRVGDATCVPPLLQVAVESDGELAKAAKAALSELPGQQIDEDIVVRLHGAQGKIYTLLIELVGERRIKAVDELVKALDNNDDAVRVAALTSLGTTVPANKMSVLIAQVVSPTHPEDVSAAERALKAAAIRMADREACAKEIAAAIERSPIPIKIALLKILGAVGGTEALASIAAAARSGDEELQDASSRLLGSWMTIDAAPVLLDLAKAGPSDKYRVRALRGYIRIARQFVMPEQQRCDMCENALQAAVQPAEQKLVLDILKRYRNLGTLQLAAKITRERPQLHKEATQAVLSIARELGDEKHSGTADEARAMLARAHLDKVKLEIVKADYGVAGKQKDVTKVLRDHANGTQVIALPSPGYVAAFGGDPAPGTPKQLKVQYRIDDKLGEATFGDNALVILPLPK